MLLTRCGDNLPLVKESYVDLAERIRFSVLKLSKGNLADLETNIAAAHQDWRDVLMAAGFGESETAHRDWLP